MVVVRSSAVVVVGVEGLSAATSDYEEGPLAMVMPHGGATNAQARRTYFTTRAADVLYGTTGTPDYCARWNRVCNVEMLGSVVTGVELLRIPQYTRRSADIDVPQIESFLFVCHLALPRAEPLDTLARWLNVAQDPWATTPREASLAYRELLKGQFEVSRSWRRALSVTFLSFDFEPPLLTSQGAPVAWHASAQWLWWSASGTPFKVFSPDPEDPSVQAGVVHLSRDWRALVLRDGIGFVSLTSDDGGGESFFASAEIYVRSIYSDVLLLAVLQRNALEAFADALAQSNSLATDPVRVQRLLDDLTEFRNVMWWETATLHGVANELLVRLHEAHRTTILFNRVVEDLGNFAAQVEYRMSLRLAQTQEENRKRLEKLTKLASMVAVAFAIPALTVATMSISIRNVTVGKHLPTLLTVIVVILIAIVVGLGLASVVTWLIAREGRHGTDERV